LEEETMKTMRQTVSVVLLALLLMPLTGCEWEGAGDGFNTSRGAGMSVNFSGVYREKPSKSVVGGRGISHLVLTQTGNMLEVLDSNNRYFKGTVGSPGVVAPADAAGGYPVGADMMQAQVNFSGGDVEFMGLIRVITVVDVRSTTESDSHTETDDHTNTKTEGETTSSSTSTDATSQTDIEQQQGPAVITSSVVVQTSDSTSEDEDDTTSTTEGTTDTETYDETKTFEIDESSAMYVLEGNWVEGGSVHSVSAMTHANAGSFVL